MGTGKIGFLLGTGIFLQAVLIIMLALLIMRSGTVPAGGRYDFAVNENTKEIYIFDHNTAALYITSPETIGNYSGEMWAMLNPTEKNACLPMNRFLNDTSGRKLRSDFMRRIKQFQGADAN